MPIAYQKSLDGGRTFTQGVLDVADYTLTGGIIADRFETIKNSQNNLYIFCTKSGGYSYPKIIVINNAGTKTISQCVNDVYYNSPFNLVLSRDESKMFLATNGANSGFKLIRSVTISSLANPTFSFTNEINIASSAYPLNAIYQDRYIWVASGTTVKIYNYDTKAELANIAIPAHTPSQYSLNNTNLAVVCNIDNNFYLCVNQSGREPGGANWAGNGVLKFVFNSQNVVTPTWIKWEVNVTSEAKQLLIDRFGDLVFLTNSGAASTLLKYSNTGTLIDTVNLSVAGILGVGRGAYGLQLYSHKDKSNTVIDVYCYFGNDSGTWVTAPTTAQGQPFGAITKKRNNGETTYGDDWGGDNNYSVRC